MNGISSLHKQKGSTFLNYLLAGIIIVIAAVLAFRVSMVYINHFSINSVVRSIAENNEEANLRQSEIMELISRRLRINSTELPKDSLKIEYEGNSIKFTLEYAVEVPLYMNVNFIIHFNEQYTAERRRIN